MLGTTLGIVLAVWGTPVGPTTISLEANTWTLGELVSELGRQSERPLLLTPSMRSFKVSAFLKQEPVDNVMARLAEVFRAEWRKEPNGERLVIPNAHLMEEKSFWDDLRRGRLQRLHEDLESFAWVGRHTPDEAEELGRELDRQISQTTNTEVRSALEARRNQLHYAQSGTNGFVAYVSALGKSGIDRLFAGETVWGASGGRGTNSLPEQVLSRPLVYTGETANLESRRVLMALRLDPQALSLQCFLTVASNSGSASMTTRIGGTFGNLPLMSQHPFAKEILQWGRGASNDQASRALDSNTQPWPSRYLNNFYTMSDHLQWLHRASGLPIIAEASRDAYHWSSLQRSAPTVGQYLREFASHAPDWRLRQESGYLMVRRNPLRRGGRVEVSEELLRPLEARAAKQQLTLQDLAVLTARCSSAELEWLSNDQEVCLGFRAQALADAAAALRVWVELPAPLQQQAMRPGGLAYNEMPPAAQRRFQEALQSAFFSGGLVTGDPVALVSGPGEGLRLIVETENVIATIRQAPFPRDAEPPFTVSSDPTQRPGIRFRLGRGAHTLDFTAELPATRKQ